MKAVTVWQPWASAIALGSKCIETRSWSTKYRGPIAIHAAKRFAYDEALSISSHWNWCGALAAAGKTMGDGKDLRELLPYGAVISTAQLSDCRCTDDFTLAELDTPRRPAGATDDHLDWTEHQLGDFSLGRFGWVLTDVVPLRTPIPFTGLQGLFDVPDELLHGSMNRTTMQRGLHRC